jgi:transketolase
MAAAHFKTDKLIAILDYNQYQETGPICREMALEPLADKWCAFGWHVDEVNGHDTAAIVGKLQALQWVSGKPSILIAHTIKGKGVSFVEADFTFHGRALTPEQAARGRQEILCG